MLLVVISLLSLLAVRSTLTLDAVLDDPGMLLNLLKRNSFLRVQHQELHQCQYGDTEIFGAGCIPS